MPFTTTLRHIFAADALPMRDAFAVLFFVAVGMLFDPMFVVQQPLMTAAGLFIVLIIKPLTALFIVGVLGYYSGLAMLLRVFRVAAPG